MLTLYGLILALTLNLFKLAFLRATFSPDIENGSLKRTQKLELKQSHIGSVSTTPDPNTSAKVSRYKWEAYRDANWWCMYYFLPKGGHTFAKVCDRNGRCIAILFHTYCREQKRHIKLLHIKLFPVAPVTGPPGRVSGQKDLCSLGSEDST